MSPLRAFALEATWLALRRVPLRVTPQGVEASGRAVLTAGPHHITVCRCEKAADVASAAKRLHERAAPWLCEKGGITRQLAREVSLCRTAQRVHGMKGLAQALQKRALAEHLVFEPDVRGIHVSL